MEAREARHRAPRHLVLKGAVGLGILFLWFPLALIILYAFTTDEVVPTFPPPGLTTKWFGVLISPADLKPKS